MKRRHRQVEGAACRERSRERDGRDCEGQAQRLDHVLLVQIERPEIGHGGDIRVAAINVHFAARAKYKKDIAQEIHITADANEAAAKTVDSADPT